jgi:HK97 family phage prohead protease
MPYYISDTQSDCSGWATIKADTPESTPETIGCHQIKEDAIDQMIAVSLSEDVEPMGDWATRLIMSDTELISDDDEEEMVEPPEMNQAEESPIKMALAQAYEAVKSILEEITEKMMELHQPVEEELVEEVEIDSREQRQIDLSAPQFMRDNAEQGLKYHAEGLSGDGLLPQTVEDARKMADGEISPDKWRKIAAWIARHMVDLEAADGEITAGVVAHLLWGSGSTKKEAQRTMDYAQNIVDQLDAELEEERSESPVVEHRWVAVDKGTRSIAFTNLELRAMADGEDDWTVRGYAAVFDSPSEPLPFTEYVKRGAFKKTIKDRSDVRLLIDHTGVPLARTKSGTLTLTEDDKGLFMEARLDPANPDAVKIRSALKRGDLSQMSFAFETIKDSWNAERTVRELKEVRLHDVSIVTYPAYEETSAEMRNQQITDTTVAIVQSVSLRKAQVLLAKTRAVK